MSELSEEGCGVIGFMFAWGWLAAWASAMLDGLAFMLLWGWFIVPAFGAAPLGYGISCGVAFFVSWATYHNPPGGIKDKRGAVKRCTDATLAMIVAPVMAIVIGALLHWCVS